MKPVDGRTCSLNTRTSTRSLWQPSVKQPFSIAGLYFSVSVSQWWMALWARLDLDLCVTYCSWFCSIFLFVSYFSYNSWFPLSPSLSLSLSPLRPAFNLINIHAEIFLFLFLLYDLMVWEADVWRVDLPFTVRHCCYSLFSVRALWSLIKQTLLIFTFIFHQRALVHHPVIVTASLVFFCVSVQDKNVFLGADEVWIIHFHIYMPELHNFTLHADMKSTGFWSGGFCRKLGSNKRSPPCWKPASRLAPAAFSSLSFSLSLKTVLQFAADPLACLQRQRKRTWRSRRKWAGRR